MRRPYRVGSLVPKVGRQGSFGARNGQVRSELLYENNPHLNTPPFALRLTASTP